MYLQSILAGLNTNISSSDSEIISRVKGLFGTSDIKSPPPEVALYLGSIINRLKFIDVNCKANQSSLSSAKISSQVLSEKFIESIINELRRDSLILQVIRQQELDDIEFFERILLEDKERVQRIIDENNKIAASIQNAVINSILNESLDRVQTLIDEIPERISLLSKQEKKLEKEISLTASLVANSNKFSASLNETISTVEDKIKTMEKDAKLSDVGEMTVADKDYLKEKIGNIISINSDISRHVHQVRDDNDSMRELSKEHQRVLISNLHSTRQEILKQKDILLQAKLLKTNISSEINQMASSLDKQNELTSLANSFTDTLEDAIYDIEDEGKFERASADLERVENISLELQSKSIKNRELLEKLKLTYEDYSLIISNISKREKIEEADRESLERVIVKFKDIKEQYSKLSIDINSLRQSLVTSIDNSKTSVDVTHPSMAEKFNKSLGATEDPKLLGVADKVIAHHYKVDKGGLDLESPTASSTSPKVGIGRRHNTQNPSR